MILQHCEIGHFPQFGSCLWKNLSDFHENFITSVTLNKEVPVRFWKSSGSEVWIRSPDPYPDSRYGLRIRGRFALAEVCALRMLFLVWWFRPLQVSPIFNRSLSSTLNCSKDAPARPALFRHACCYSTIYYLRQVDYVMPAVCLFVCLCFCVC